MAKEAEMTKMMTNLFPVVVAVVAVLLVGSAALEGVQNVQAQLSSIQLVK